MTGYTISSASWAI